MGKSNDDAKRAEALATFLRDAVEGLKANNATCYRYVLDDNLAVFVGWLDGYDADDADVIHDAKHPTWCINAGVKLRCDAMWCDYDYLEMPMCDDEVLSFDYSIAPDACYLLIAVDLLKDYDNCVKR